MFPLYSLAGGGALFGVFTFPSGVERFLECLPYIPSQVGGRGSFVWNIYIP